MFKEQHLKMISRILRNEMNKYRWKAEPKNLEKCENIIIRKSIKINIYYKKIIVLSFLLLFLC